MLTLAIRTIIVYFFLLFAMRLMGKRQLGELELSELIVAVLVSDIASQPIINRDMTIIRGLTPVAVLLGCELIISLATFHSVRLRHFVFGTPSILIKDGRIDQRSMKRNRVSLDELSEAMRSGGITDISKIRYAILETDGEINLLPYASAQAATPEQTGCPAPDNGLPHIVVSRGHILENNLRVAGKSLGWLDEELKNRGVKDIGEVYCLSVDDTGAVYFLRNEE